MQGLQGLPEQQGRDVCDHYIVDCLSRIDTLCARWFASHRRMEMVQPRVTVVHARENVGTVILSIVLTLFVTLTVLALVMRMWR